MSQSLAKILIHLVFSTKNRQPLLDNELREELHRYAAGVLLEWDSPAILINSVEDHVHILYSHSKNHSPAEIVENVKTATSKWLKTKAEIYRGFHWQSGYGDFSVSQSNVPGMVKYIAEQREHHRQTTFQEEYRKFLQRHEIPYDERYAWD